MTSIHDEDPGSQKHRPSAAPREWEGLAARRDELELVIAVASVGFCRLDARTFAASANAQFKSEFGWPPDAEFSWEELLQRVRREDRERLRFAVIAAIENGTELFLTVGAEWPDGSAQSIELRGRALLTEFGVPDRLIVTSRNVTAESAATADERREHTAATEHERRLRQG